jgi:hypothetical protein
MSSPSLPTILRSYFDLTDSTILNQDEKCMTVKFSPEVDKAIGRRPYYWAFVERTHTPPQPMTLTFCLQGSLPERNDYDQPFVERLCVGSSRLTDIFHDINKRGAHVELYETPCQFTPNPRFDTWLNVNLQIEYQAHSCRTELHSYGICLRTGAFATHFMEQLENVPLQARIPLYFQQNPNLSLTRAKQLLEQHLSSYLTTYDHNWAVDANHHLQKETSAAARYFADHEREGYATRQTELYEQFQPTITISVINCGLFHFLNHRPKSQ